MSGRCTLAAIQEELTGRENLEIVGRLYHLSWPRARGRAAGLLGRFGLSDAANRPAKTYSGGMQRRLDLAASLVGQPKVLFLDEPTSGLDPRSRLGVQAFGLVWLFPLTFLSSAFVPISTMPGWLQAFANNQPVTFVVNTMRSMALGGPIAADLWKSIAWLAGIFIVFAPLAVRAYKRAA
jgi:hypothetical protein